MVAGTGFGSVRLLAAVGDITGDGYPDLMGQPSGGSMRIYPGNGATGFSASYVAHAALTADPAGRRRAAGTPTAPRTPSLRRSDGSLVLYPGNGPGGLTGGDQGRVARAAATTGCSAVGRRRRRRAAGPAGPGESSGTLWLLPGTATGLRRRASCSCGGLARFDLAG